MLQEAKTFQLNKDNQGYQITIHLKHISNNYISIKLMMKYINKSGSWYKRMSFLFMK